MGASGPSCSLPFVVTMQGGRAEKYCGRPSQYRTNHHAESCPVVSSPLPIINGERAHPKKSPGPSQTIGCHLETSPNPCCTRFARRTGTRHRPRRARRHRTHFFPWTTTFRGLPSPVPRSSFLHAALPNPCAATIKPSLSHAHPRRVANHLTTLSAISHPLLLLTTSTRSLSPSIYFSTLFFVFATTPHALTLARQASISIPNATLDMQHR